VVVCEISSPNLTRENGLSACFGRVNPDFKPQSQLKKKKKKKKGRPEKLF
jgi:hypothetical protein